MLASLDIQRLAIGNGPIGLASSLRERGQRAADATPVTDRRYSEGEGGRRVIQKKEADGEHPASHYLVVEDPGRPQSWHLRVRDVDGKLDHRLMGAAWAALDRGYRGERYEGPHKQEAIAALKRLYQREGMKTPRERGRLRGLGSEEPEVRSQEPEVEGQGRTGGHTPALQFVAALAEAAASGRVRIPLAVTGTWARGAEKFSITRQDLECIAENFAGRKNGEINVDYDHASEMPEVAAGGPIPSAGRIVRIDPPEALRAGGWGLGIGEPASGRKPARLPSRGPQSPASSARFILWGWYEPTERARALIGRREYRYISPAIDWGARSKRTGRPQGATLTSVALTNRPFLEELPQIHLSDPSYRWVGEGGAAAAVRRSGMAAPALGSSCAAQVAGHGPARQGRLIDVGDVHVETSLPEESGDRSQKPEVEGQGRTGGHRPPRQPGGGFMKKVDVSAADGKVALGHPDFTDEYYADPAELQEVLEEMGLAEDPEEAAQDDIPLEQAAAALSEADTRGKRVPAVEVFRARVEQALDEAVKVGKILPRQRGEWRRVGLADFTVFSKLLSEQPGRVPLRPIGFSSTGPVDAGTQVKFLAEQRMRERGISYGQALSELGREQPDLIQRYRRAVSGE